MRRSGSKIIMFVSVLFFIFSFFILGSALLVISSKNPVNSVIFLIFSFFNASAIFLIAGAEFLALIMLIVYVGAVAVLFLFVIMMLDLNYDDIKRESKKYFKTIYLVGFVLLLEMGLLFYHSQSGLNFLEKNNIVNSDQSNTEIIGSVIYTNHFYHFQISGLILLVAMIGAIVLTLRHRDNVKRQDINKQVQRDQEKNIELKNLVFEENE